MFEVFGLGAEFTFDSAGTEKISDIVGRLRVLDKQMKLSADETVEYSETLNKFSGVLASMGRSFVTAGTIQTATALYGVGKAAKWQTQMIDASRYMTDTSNKAQVEYNTTLKETAQLLGRTKEEINDSVVSYMMMGKSTDEALRLSKNAGYAAVTWSMTASSVADSFRSIKAAFNINLEDQAMYKRYLDTINEVGNSTAATSADVVNFLADGGAALHNVANVSIEQAMGMASAARYANMSISEFSTMMTRLGNQYAQDKSSKFFKALKVDVKDTNGQMRSFADVLYDVQKKWNDLDTATKSKFVSGVGGLYADRLSLYMGSGEEYQKGSQIANQDNTGSADAEFARVTKTFSVAMSRLKVTLNDFTTSFWGTLLPMLTGFVSGIDTVVKHFSNFAQAHPMVMKLVAGFILLSGVMLIVLGSGLLLTSMFAKLRASQVLNHFITLRTQLTMHGLATVFGKVGLSVISLTAKFAALSLSMGLVYLAWKYDIFNIRSMFEEFISKLKLSFVNAKKLFDGSLSLDKFRQTVGELNNSNSVFDKLALGIAKVGLAFKALMDYFGKGFVSDDMFARLSDMGLMPMITIIIGLEMRFKAFFNGVKEGFMDTINSVNTWVKDKFGPPLQWLHDKVLVPVATAIFGVRDRVNELGEASDGIKFVDLDKMFGKIETWESVGRVIGDVLAILLMLKTASTVINVITMIGGALGKLGTGAMAVANFLGPVVTTILKFGGSLLTGLGTWGSILATTFGEVIAGTTTVGAAFAEMFPTIAGAFSGLGTLLSGIGGVVMTVLGVIGGVVTAVLGFFGIVVTAPAWIVGAITVAIAGIIVAVVHFKDEIWNFLTVTIPSAISTAWTAFTGWLTALPEQVGFTIGFIGGKIIGFFINTLPEVFNNAKETVANWVESIGIFFTVEVPRHFVAMGNSIRNFFYNTLPEFLASAIDTILKWGDDVEQFFKVTVPEFFTDLPAKFEQFAKDVIDGFVNGIASLKEKAGQAITDFVDGIKKGFTAGLGIHSPSTVANEYGVNTIQGFNDGINSMKTSASTAITGITDAIAEKLGNMKATAQDWGSNMISGFVTGMQSAKTKVSTAAGNAIKAAKGFIGFNSPSKEGEGRHIVEWGHNMISGFADGIVSAKGLLRDTMTDVITNPISGITGGNVDIPVNTNVNQITRVTPVNTSDNIVETAIAPAKLTSLPNDNLNGITTTPINLTQPVEPYVRGQIESANGGLSDTPIERIKERVSTAESSVINKKNGDLNITIENGAIQNSFTVDGAKDDRESLIELLKDVLDDELLPMLLYKIRELKAVLNE